MQRLRDDLRAAGLDVADLTAEVNLRHLHVGQREHWSGGEVGVFVPVAESLRLFAGDGAQPVMQATFPGAPGAPGAPGGSGARAEGAAKAPETTIGAAKAPESDKDAEARVEADLAERNAHQAAAKAHWASVQTSAGWDGPTVASLARNLIEHHRPLTGELHTTHEQIESDPHEIDRILRRRETLRVGLSPLLQVIEANDALFAALLRSHDERDDNDKWTDALYERDRHLREFRDHPCERDLYDALRQSARDGDWLGTMTFPQYYAWYLRSNAEFGGAKALDADVGDRVRKTFTAWTSADDERSPDRLENHLRWIWRNYEVHPHHRAAVGRALTELYEDPQERPRTKPGPRP